MKLYNLLKHEDKNFNLLPYFSFFWGNDYGYLSAGWLNICLQITLKSKINTYSSLFKEMGDMKKLLHRYSPSSNKYKKVSNRIKFLDSKLREMERSVLRAH